MLLVLLQIYLSFSKKIFTILTAASAINQKL